MTGVDLADELRGALARGEFHVAYQPKYDLFRRRITGVEALVRWRHPSRGMISPAAFIPEAERAGLIAPLGEWVLAEACRQAAVWHGQGIALHMAVNISPLQLGDPGRLERSVAGTLEKCGLAAGALELEVTESVLMDPDARIGLDALADRGIGIALDDFGTGYSSLSYLKRLRAHTLKIDKSFIDGLPGSLDDCMLVGSIVRLAHSFGMQVVAEGVEGLDQLEVLEVLECDVVQGYAIARPLPPEAIPDLLSQPTAQPAA